MSQSEIPDALRDQIEALHPSAGVAGASQTTNTSYKECAKFALDVVENSGVQSKLKDLEHNAVEVAPVLRMLRRIAEGELVVVTANEAP